MKVTLSFKTPDVLDYVTEGMTEDQKAKVEKTAKKFVKYDECVYIELDTKAGTAKVLPV